MRSAIKHIAALFVIAVLMSACSSSINPVQTETIVTETWQELYDLGMRYLTDGNYEEAIIAFTRAIDIDSKQYLPYEGRGDAYYGIGQNATDASVLTNNENTYLNAISDYKTAVELSPEQANVFVKLGTAYSVTEEYTSAIDAYTSALAIESKLTEALVGRGDAYIELIAQRMAEIDVREKEDSEEDNTEEGALEENDELPDEIVELYNKAKEDYLSAMELDNQVTELYLKVADIYTALKDNDSAISILEKGYEITGDETIASRLAELLKDRSHIVTVDAEIIDNIDVYRNRYEELNQQYDGYRTTNVGAVGILRRGIRFTPAVSVMINGVETAISEARFMNGNGDYTPGFRTVTGYFVYTGEEELHPISEDMAAHGVKFLYNPNGPYQFKTVSLDKNLDDNNG